jgi:hypothetical protein
MFQGINGKAQARPPQAERFPCPSCNVGTAATAGKVCGYCEIDRHAAADPPSPPHESDTETQRHIPPERCVTESPCASESSCATVSSVSEFLHAVFEAAMKKPLPTVASKYYLPKMQRLIALCAELQIAAGEGTFFLSCRDAGDLIGEDFRKAWGWLKKLEFDGVLKRISTGSKGNHKANEYVFSGRTSTPPF